MGHNLIDLAQAITKKAPKSLPDQYSKELRYTVGQMLKKDPARRPAVKDVVGFVPERIAEFYRQFPRAIEIPKSVWEAKPKAGQASGAMATVSRASSTPMSVPSEPTLHDAPSSDNRNGSARHAVQAPSPVPESAEEGTASPSPSPSLEATAEEDGTSTPRRGAGAAAAQPSPESEKGGADERVAASRQRPSSAGPGRPGSARQRPSSARVRERSRAGPIGSGVPWAQQRPGAQQRRQHQAQLRGQRPGSAQSQRQQPQPQPRAQPQPQPQPQQQQQPQTQSAGARDESRSSGEDAWPDRLTKPVRWAGPQVPPSPSRSTAGSTAGSGSGSTMVKSQSSGSAGCKPQTLLLEHPSEKFVEQAARPSPKVSTALAWLRFQQ